MDITLIIPTKNRLHFLKKLLKYYSDLKFNGNILVLDDSDNVDYNKSNIFIKKIQELNITHIKLNSSNGGGPGTLRESFSYLDTEFVSWLGDDDYLIPNGIEQCIQHLRDNNDLAATQGEGLIIGTPNFSTVPHIQAVHPYLGPIRLEDKACERFVNQYSNYKTPFFAVFRSEIFKKIYNFFSLEELKQHCPYKLISDELLYSALCVIFGKFDKIKTLHVIRGIHKGRGGQRLKELIITTEDKKKSINYFTKIISQAINESDKRPIIELENIARDSLNNYLKCYNVPKKNSILKQTIRKILAKLHLLGLIRNFKRNAYNQAEFGLASLLNPENIYHKDFIQVYNSMLSNDNYNIE